MEEKTKLKGLLEVVAMQGVPSEEQIDEIITIVEEMLQSEKSNEIEMILNEYLDSETVSAVDTLMEAISFVVENTNIVVDSKEYESTMQLIPCTFATKGGGATLPSINSIESKIRSELLKNNVINSEEQFHLGTVRLSQEAVSEMRITDWFSMHNDILTEVMSSAKEDNRDLREKETFIDDDKTVSVFYLVCSILDREHNAQILSNLYESVADISLWSNMCHNVGEKNVTITMFPPTSIIEGIENVNFVMQGLEFDVFFNEFSSPKDTEIAYAKVSEQKNEFVVIFLDGEDKTIRQYYIYDDQGYPEDFVNVLLTKCSEKSYCRLYRLNSEVSDETLDLWSKSEIDPDISDLVNESDEIDIETSKKIYELINPNFSTFSSGTIH